MDVLFENNTNEEINYKLIEKVISEALRYEGVNDNTEVSVTIVDNEEIRKINNKFRNIDRATDVLSFPLIDFDNESLPDDGSKIYLGDIIISIERAKEQAKEYGHSIDFNHWTSNLYRHHCLGCTKNESSIDSIGRFCY